MVNEIKIRLGASAVLSLVVLLMAMACGSDPYTPDNPDVQKNLYSLYPNARDISWSKKGDYFVADCWDGNNELDVWFNQNAEWVMTETEIFRSQLPASVNTAFTNSEYGKWTVLNLTLLSFPSDPGAMYVIEVENENKDKEMALYYSDYGELAHSYDITDADKTHWPDVSLAS